MKARTAKIPGASAGLIRNLCLIGATATFGLLSVGAASAQHLHGQIELGVVVEDQTLAIALRSPLADLMGFEHAPENDDQTQRLQRAVNLLTSAEAMFGLPESARCTIESIDIEGPEYLELAASASTEEAGHHESDHQNDHHQDKHDDDHDHHDDHDDKGGHAEVNAQYSWACSDIDQLDAVEAHFTGQFESVENVEVQVLTPATTQFFKAAVSTKPLTVSLR